MSKKKIKKYKTLKLNLSPAQKEDLLIKSNVAKLFYQLIKIKNGKV